MYLKKPYLIYGLITCLVCAFGANFLFASEGGDQNGRIVGKVTYAGTIVTPKKLSITKDTEICGQVEHVSEALLVSQDKGLANVVVSLTSVNGGKSLDALGTDFVLDQKGCKFTPHVMVVPVGAQLTVKNEDGILHNIHTFGKKNRPKNIAQPRFRKEVTLKFKKPEIIRIVCDVHNWMNCYIAVADHPYYATTDVSGNFELGDVPAGTYTLRFWHEKLGEQTQQVTVTDGGVAKADSKFSAK